MQVLNVLFFSKLSFQFLDYFSHSIIHSTNLALLYFWLSVSLASMQASLSLNGSQSNDIILLLCAF
jgi:hypothetical protein